MSTTAINPWYRKEGISRPTYSLDSRPLFEHRGVEVYKLKIGSYLYVLAGTAITERAGFSKAAAPSIIDNILDGKVPVSDAVIEVLRANGFKGLTHSEYMIEYNAGRMA